MVEKVEVSDHVIIGVVLTAGHGSQRKSCVNMPNATLLVPHKVLEKRRTKYTEMATVTEEEESVKLLTAWPSPYGMRALIALEEKRIHFQYVEENLRSKSPLLLEMNPVYGKVPVLIHNGRPLAESLVIVQYVDEMWSSASSLLPSHPYGRASARFWADFIDKKVFFPGLQIFKTQGEEQEAMKREFLESLVILEGVLKGKEYFGGDTFGFVDIAMAPMIAWFHALESIGGFKISFEENLECMKEWKAKCMARESVAKALPPPEKVLEFAIQLRKILLG